MALVCSRCGAKQGLMAALNRDLGSAEYVCDSCTFEIANRAEAESRRLVELAAKVIVTTTHTIEGHTIIRYLGIESVEFVIGTGVFSEIGTDFQDFLGLRSTAFERKLRTAKDTAFEALRIAAAEKGANAVLGADLDFTEFSGNRVGLILNGTLVEVGPEHG